MPQQRLSCVRSYSTQTRSLALRAVHHGLTESVLGLMAYYSRLPLISLLATTPTTGQTAGHDNIDLCRGGCCTYTNT